MENPRARYSAAQRLICKLRDVSSCQIRADDDDTITAVHVTALAGRSPKQIARDVEAILAAEEGVHLDHRKISVAQYGEGDLPGPEMLERVSVGGLTLHQRAGDFEAEVRLTSGSLEAEGRAVGPNTRFEARRIVAQATLDALAKLVNGDPGLSLGELEERDLGGRRVMLVCVNRTEGRTESHLTGCCEISYDPTQAVIHAVLDAVNRLIGTLRPREPVEYEVGPVPVE